ncbi:PorT family protein [Tenacibaculum sp. 190524A02b]|uniref:PorT family protein n=1 Tax=Tenacibaculum vairaonense TaxID=3137860 RepID=A0ABP1FCT2_9FLAO
MKNCILYLALFIYSFNSFAQNTFKKGYFISNNNQRTECLIEDLDWMNNPSKLNYKLNDSSDKKNKAIKNIKEFGIYNISKYVRKKVNIDRSSSNINKLSNKRAPAFKEETLFLKVLIEGKANLYSYQHDNLRRFFYSVNNTDTKQLIYKKFKVKEYSVAVNERYKQQLLKEVTCENKTFNVKKLHYTTSSLSKFFIKYNQCHNALTTSLIKKRKAKNSFNLSIKAGFSTSSLDADNNISNDRNTDFGSKNGFRAGIELEYILPFNNDKWGIYTKPTYQSFKASKQKSSDFVVGGLFKADADYSSIELPLGLRHYFFLNKKSKLFAQVAYVFDFPFSSNIDIKRNDNSILSDLDINSENNLAFGVGYKYDKYSIELEFQENRDILGDYVYWQGNYQSFNITLGYTLF